MFQQVGLARLGQMQFISPQMGPSMSPGFAFATTTGNQTPMPTAPTPTPVPMAQNFGPSMPVAPAGSIAPPAPATYQSLIVPTIALAAVALVIGLSV